MKTTESSINELATQAKTDSTAFEELYVQLGTEKYRFIRTVSAHSNHYVDAEAVYNDVFMEVVTEWTGHGNFMALLRMRLSSRRLDANKAELRRLERQWKYCEFMRLFMNADTDHAQEIAFKQYLQSLDGPLCKAVELIDAGYSLRQVSVELGYRSHNTLKSQLRKAFEQFVSL